MKTSILLKRTAILLSCLSFLFLSSCGKVDEPEIPDYNNDPAPQKYDMEVLMTTFESALDSWPDENKYDEALLCGKIWHASDIYLETYNDGKLTNTTDWIWGGYSDLFLNANYSMRRADSRGVWRYLNNHIIMRVDGSSYHYEVTNLTQSGLTLTELEGIDRNGDYVYIKIEYQPLK